VAFFSGRRCLALALLSGGLLWLGFPGGGELPGVLALALLPVLLVAQRAGSGRAAFLAGLLAGMVHFALLLYWIVIVLGRYGGLNLAVSLLALTLLVVYMSLYFGLFVLGARQLLGSLPAAAALWLVPALWVGLDWLRGLLFTGLPWMDLGYALYQTPWVIQVSDLVGHHGVSFLLVLVNTLLMLLCRRCAVRPALLLAAPVLLLLLGAGWYSQLRLTGVQESLAASDRPAFPVGVVQGNIDQSEKWSTAMQQATVDGYISLTRGLFVNDRPALVVWPETALPFYPQAEGKLTPVRALVAGENFALLTGAPWYEKVDSEPVRLQFFNSALLLEADGGLVGRYDKHHLVPFGEYVPLKKLLPFLAPLVETVGDFTPGGIEQPLVAGKLRIGTLICFESVFPELSRAWVNAGANILVNLTNDAWYGKSSAPWHSLAMAVFRAVETRRSLVRSANTGISAFIAPTGEILLRSELFVTWAGQARMTLSDERTIWVRFGYLFAPICLLFAVGGLLRGSLLLRYRPEQR